MMVIRIHVISIFQEDNILSVNASLPYSPLTNTDIDYYVPFLVTCYAESLRGIVVKLLAF